MNWLTMIETIKGRSNKGASEYTRIARAACDSIQLHRRERLRWNQATAAITLTANFETYGVTASTGVAAGLPADLIAFVGKYQYVDAAGSESSRSPVLRKTRDVLRQMRVDSPSTGTPAYWAFWDERLEIYPASDSSTSIFRADYIQDVGTLLYKVVAGVWKFYRPDGTTELTTTDIYTSPWFDQTRGFNLIAEHALWQLWNGVWQATAGQAEMAAQRYAEALAGARDTTDGQIVVHELEPYLPAYPGSMG